VSAPIILTLYSKPGCHLCEEAKLAIDSVVLQTRSENSSDVQIEITEVNILEDAELLERYGEEIPVLQINGETHAYWTIDKDRLRKALENLF
jgi:glutaredoxin